MGRGVNKVFLLGRLGRDPEIKYTQDGTPIANFNLATSHGVKRGDVWEEETDWHRIVASARLAEVCEQYLVKGSQVWIEGRLRTRSWEDKKGGGKRYTTEVVAKEIQLCGGERKNADDGEIRETVTAPAARAQAPDDDDVPF